MANLGEVFVESHVDNKAVYPELKRGVEEAGQKVEKEDDFGGFVKAANKAGSRAGKEFGDGFMAGDPAALATFRTWAQVKSEFATWSAVNTGGRTWGRLLAGS